MLIVSVRLEDPLVLAALFSAAGLVVAALIKGIVKIICTRMLSPKKHRSKGSKRKKPRKGLKQKEHGRSEPIRSPPP